MLATKTDRAPAPAEVLLRAAPCAPTLQRPRRRRLSARRRCGGIPSGDFRGRDEGSTCATMARFLGGPAFCADRSSGGRPTGDASAAPSPVSRESSPRPAEAARDSAPQTGPDQLASASAEAPAGAASRPRVARTGSPAPSSGAAAPAATRARRSCVRPDTQTTRASSPPSTTTRAPKVASRDASEGPAEFANPTPSNKNGLPDLRLLPDAPVPDGRTVLTSPDTIGDEAVRGHGRHPPPFIRDTNPLERLNREIGPPHRRRQHLPRRRLADPARHEPRHRAERRVARRTAPPVARRARAAPRGAGRSRRTGGVELTAA